VLVATVSCAKTDKHIEMPFAQATTHYLIPQQEGQGAGTSAGLRVCAVALYAVLEANTKVNGRGPFSHPNPSETPQPISMSCQIYYYVPQGVDVQNLVGIDSAVTDLRMREKTYLSICLSSVSSSGLQATVLGRFLRLVAKTT